MEARRFGFAGEPPAFKFDPTDADLVADYLLPRALDLHNPHAHAIIEDDPGRCPPWELLRRHGHAGSDHAFFFAPPRDPVKKERARRAVPPGEDGGPGGVWRGQKGQEEELFLHRGGGGAGGEIAIRFKRYNLTYYNDGEDKTSGWVMNEYQIVEPPLLPGHVLAHVKITDKAKKDRHKQRQKTAPAKDAMKSVRYYDPDQPAGPSSSCYAADGHAAGNAFVASGTSGRAQASVVQQECDDGADMGEPVVNYDGTEFFHSGEGIGSYVEDDNNNYYIENMNGHFNQQAYAADNRDYGGGSSSYYYHVESSNTKHETDDGYGG